MSADLHFYERPHTNERVSMSMRASGFMELTVSDYSEEADEHEGMSSIGFMPNAEGRKAARDLAESLLSWAKHVEEAGLDSP